MINSFRGQYRFLSNFYPCEGLIGPTVEHDYQANKFVGHPTIIKLIMNDDDPGNAKRVAGAFKHFTDKDWNNKSIQLMYLLLTIKFNKQVNSSIHNMLLRTDDMYIVEGNNWHDNFWGSCICHRCGNRGVNNLGILIMTIRGTIL